ncbi:MAG: hypothetical protein Q9220_005662 [cf. Caloplaca sp. 1 TL-2023]
MNWTGGSLSRSRKQKTDISLAQKAHFAKARGRLLSGQPPRPRIDHTVFQDGSLHHIAPSLTASNTSPQRKYGTSQLTLEEYENVRPLVQQLQTLKPRQRHRTAVEHRSDGLQRREKSIGLQGEHMDRLAHAQTRKYIEGAYRSSHNSVTPPLTDRLEAKRQQLLASFDWVGIEKMKPLKLQFQEAEERDLVGKRRILKATRKGDHPVVQQQRRPVVNIHEKLNILRASSKSLSSTEKMSIHIGTSENGSSTYRKKRCPASGQALLEELQSSRRSRRKLSSPQSAFCLPSQSSDEMLFDYEWSDMTPAPVKYPVPVTACLQDQSELDHSQPTKSRVHQHETCIISSGTESECTGKSQEDEEESEFHQGAGTSMRAYIGDEPPFAQATAQDLADLCHAGGDPLTISHCVQDGKHIGAALTVVGPEVDYLPVQAEAADVRVPCEERKASSDLSALSGPQLKAALTDTVQSLDELALEQRQPTPHALDLKSKSQPSLPSFQQEDEVLWRSFVFGTEHASQDWTLEPPLEPSIIPLKPHTHTTSSSPILGAPYSNPEVPSSPIPRTQPSLLAEASFPSPTKCTNDIPELALRPASSSSPSHTHHSSLVAQPSVSPISPLHQIYASSSDELARSPTRLAPPPPPPPVTFRKPKPYIGEAVTAVASPLRLGMGNAVASKQRKRKRRASPASEDGEGGDEDLEKGRRKDWRRRRDGYSSGFHGEDDAEDDIIDDLMGFI